MSDDERRARQILAATEYFSVAGGPPCDNWEPFDLDNDEDCRHCPWSRAEHLLYGLLAALSSPSPQPERIGVLVKCLTCGYAKKPIGRSGPLGASYCDDQCAGYREYPFPGSLWPGETESQFGYPVGNDGTKLADRSSPSETPK